MKDILNKALAANDATFEWHNNTWMQVADNA